MVLILPAHENQVGNKHVESTLVPRLDEGSSPSISTMCYRTFSDKTSKTSGYQAVRGFCCVTEVGLSLSRYAKNSGSFLLENAAVKTLPVRVYFKSLYCRMAEGHDTMQRPHEMHLLVPVSRGAETYSSQALFLHELVFSESKVNNFAFRKEI